MDKNDMIDISVVMPVYNAEEFLEQAIDSVLAQVEVTHLLLADDGSSDKSFDICKRKAKEDNRIEILTHEQRVNKGVAATRNLALQHVKTEYVAFLDADDYYLPNRFKKSLEVLNKYPDADGVYELIGVVYSGDNEAEKKRVSTQESTFLDDVEPEELFFQLYPIGLGRGYFNADGLVVKKSMFEKVGYFDEEMETCEDLLMWCKMAAVGIFYPGERSQPVTIARRYDGGLTGNSERVKRSFVKFSDKMIDFVSPILNEKQKTLFIDRYYFMQLFYRNLYKPNSIQTYFKRLKFFFKATSNIIHHLDSKYLMKIDFYKQLFHVVKP